MNKFYFSLLIVLFTINEAVAQAPKGMGSNDPKAKVILDAVSAKLRTYKNVESKFSILIENAANKAIGKKAGDFFFKGNKYRIVATGQEVISDGANTWTYDKASKEVTINKVEPNSSAITPQKLFTNFYDKDFLYKLNGTKGAISEIELTPLDKSKPIFKILLYVSNNSITSAKFLEKSGNKYTLSITGVKPNGAVPDTKFVFDAKKYPGVEVVDLR
jgi:outer membrane lipoprotein carrier protein